MLASTKRSGLKVWPSTGKIGSITFDLSTSSLRLKFLRRLRAATLRFGSKFTPPANSYNGLNAPAEKTENMAYIVNI